ncbi:MAG: hydroxymyristoyl-ACP dehydratase [Gammaproteobacteria bacterium]|nr:hydroxymyristoyl-ACP dehydratase [Gammaproteobacteria bacterium]NIM73093.1 hydroxymyristoyl-ACP dehydratase [Gammaproteobacteria bacterium]NIN38710.1 hydroxymyristoyl-ACP dehydratase [Gammaproteobacteria bacterium]NIO24846.1 hydroxymyristoyl-ACP dehydratase [Gammaproteobacteria bacterium]NIO65449.1 hydroxymyristoyl-ACP dehydratase [Gammaproteobacteria bacterium]
MSFQVHRTITNEHPALAGHFPGNPVVPAVLILDEVLRAAEQWRGKLRLKSVETVKFSSPLRPGQSFSIELRCDDDSYIAFECRYGANRIASGRLAVECETGGS